MSRWFYGLLLFAVLSAVIEVFRFPWPPMILFVSAALGIIPFAALIGQAVERIAEHTGERVGGLLFATFGNATELIIGIFALRDGLIEVVRASIIGSILGNALLVLGVATVIGSAHVGRLHFETRPASQYASLLALCVGGLLLPTCAELLASHNGLPQPWITQQGIMLSDFIAVLLLLGYIASILFSVFRLGDKPGDVESDEFDPLVGERSTVAVMRLLDYRRHLASTMRPNKSGVLRDIDNTLKVILKHEGNQLPPGQSAATPHESKPRLIPALLLLTGATVGVAWLSDILVSTIEPLTTVLHWNSAFVGLVFVPLIGGLPEYFNTINMSLDKRMGMVLAASAGSSIQIALLMAPILVLVSLVMPMRLDLVFSIVELAVLGLATFLFSEITRDGELVWLEGLLLILLYAMMAGTVFLFGA